ncbi:MAG: cytochrome c biogenesis protein CcdA [Vampirovibrionales bacterium]|nr:cytochrome c biogenesis protein CcdA [Vampirovibrionales bacterium]
MTLQNQLISALSNHSIAVIGLSFAGGVISSLLPCAISMLPVLIGYVGGYTEDSRWDILRQVLLFIVGVSLVMTILGVSASLLGVAFGGLVGSNWYYLVGVIAILMGLHLLHIIQVPLPQFITRLPETKSGHVFAPIMLGMAFGAASSPCGTPFLTAILGFISQEKHILLGAGSLFAYALGQSMLLLVVGLFTGLLKHIAIVRHVGKVINALSGAIFILAGLLLIAQGAGWLDALASILE